jgi:WD40 repeat protein
VFFNVICHFPSGWHRPTAFMKFLCEPMEVRLHSTRPLCRYYYLFLFFLGFAGCSLFYGSKTLDSISIEGKISIVSDLEAQIQGFSSNSPEQMISVVSGASWDIQELPLSAFKIAKVHDGDINSLIVSRDGRSAFSGGSDGKVIITSISRESGREGDYHIYSEELAIGTKPIVAMALSQDERMLAVAQPSLVAIIDLRSRLFLYKMTRIDGRITALAWDPHGQILAVGRTNGDVFVWNVTDGMSAGEDSNDALEVYSAANSPIIGIVFHPSSRVFFVAEAGGTISIWRLLRTEVEMGLRDSWAVIDKLRTTTKRKAFARVKSKINDIWLNAEGSILYVAASDGSIYRWKVRGLSLREPLQIGQDAVFSITGSETLVADRADLSPIVVSADRSQRIKYWCAANNFGTPKSTISGVEALTPVAQQSATPDDDINDTSGLTTNDSDADTSSVSLAAEKASQVVTDTELNDVSNSSFRVAQHQTEDATVITQRGFITQSEIFKTPASIVRMGSAEPFLWASQKTGSLVVFDTQLHMTHSVEFSERVSNCKGLFK